MPCSAAHPAAQPAVTLPPIATSRRSKYAFRPARGTGKGNNEDKGGKAPLVYYLSMHGTWAPCELGMLEYMQKRPCSPD